MTIDKVQAKKPKAKSKAKAKSTKVPVLKAINTRKLPRNPADDFSTEVDAKIPEFRTRATVPKPIRLKIAAEQITAAQKVLENPNSTNEQRQEAHYIIDRASRITPDMSIPEFPSTVWAEVVMAFSREYTIDFDHLAAMRRALPPTHSGRNITAIRTAANRAMGEPAFREYLNKWRTKMAKTVVKEIEVTAERVIKEMARVAFMDIRSIFDEDGKLLPVKKLSEDAAAAISSVETVTVGNQNVGMGEITKVKLVDKMRALENLGRHLGLFNDRLDLSVKGGLNNTNVDITPEELAAMTPAELASLYRDRVMGA